MLVTFHSKAWSSITLFGDVATKLLQMMGHSGTVPSALLAADVPAALARLRQELVAAEPEQKSRQKPRDDEETAGAPQVTLRQRAYPLIQLLSAAAERHCDVIWVKGNPAV